MSEAEVLNETAQAQVKTIIERVERIAAEEADLREAKKEIYAEAKGNGYDIKALKKVVRLRKIDRAKRQEEEAILDVYMSAIGEI
jgi:uncharacterized protein (UPF0335 family)